MYVYYMKTKLQDCSEIVMCTLQLFKLFPQNMETPGLLRNLCSIKANAYYGRIWPGKSENTNAGCLSMLTLPVLYRGMECYFPSFNHKRMTARRGALSHFYPNRIFCERLEKARLYRHV